tara:strand:+ start:25 stop:612 length:588 start_codon:yes stop_codon:yes gene_type:complete
MPVTINGDGSITGLSNGSLSANVLTDSTVTSAKFASGAITSTMLPAGSVIQVVEGSTENRIEITGGTGSWVDTNLSATITPSSSSNKVLVLVNGSIHTGNTSSAALTVFRGGTGGTDIGSSGGYGLLHVNGTATSGGGGGTLNGGMVKLDSPNTDQATEYLVKAKRVWAGAGGHTKFPSSNNYEKATITLMEIVA